VGGGLGFRAVPINFPGPSPGRSNVASDVCFVLHMGFLLPFSPSLIRFRVEPQCGYLAALFSVRNTRVWNAYLGIALESVTGYLKF
jgi:hypothetical protein